jgi:23S rRNA (cytosine1962-C5)-methyltransferase
VQSVDDEPATPFGDYAGATVDLLSFNGDFLARAAYSPTSQIRARVWTFEDEPVDAEFFRRKIHAAIAQRSTFNLQLSTNALRLIHAESDGLPGLIVDRYGDVLVLQSLTTGSEFWKETIADILLEEMGLSTIYERSDADVRELEGLPPKVGVLRGSTLHDPLIITEHGLQFQVDLQGGHKTGFYLDQRANRAALRGIAQDRSVLNCFSYTGAFTVYALAGGAASVLSIDSSAEALALGQENVALNQFSSERAAWLEADVFHALRGLRDRAQSYDLIILDPPKFAASAAQAERAARGYKDINLLAFKLLKPGGLLFTFSCSGGVTPDLFQKIVAGAALDAGVEARTIQTLTQGRDHPVALNFPEGAYLKGLVCAIS